MLRPSYNQLIKKVNENYETEEPVVRSRYSIVLAAAKRARQLVDGNIAYTSGDVRKPLSVAVAELNEGLVKIVPEGVNPEDPELLRIAREYKAAEETTAETAEQDTAEEAVSGEQPESAEAVDTVPEEKTETEESGAGEAFAAESTEEVQV